MKDTSPAPNTSKEHRRSKESTASLVVRLMLLVVLGIAVLASVYTLVLRVRAGTFADPILQARLLIRNAHVNEVSDGQLQAGAIRGMVQSLDDPYSTYIVQAGTPNFRKDLLGEYVGIGVSVVMLDGVLTVVTPLDGSPAHRAGVRADDQIVTIDGAPIAGMSSDDAVELMTGTPGTSVTITVKRAEITLPITIQRAEITTQTVKGIARVGGDDHWRYVLDADQSIAYIRLTQFNPTTAGELRDAINTATNNIGQFDGQLNGLILDLRSNPGGLLEQAVTIADDFLDAGTIVSTRGRGAPDKTYTAIAGQIIDADTAVVVLIDAHSASASEILAGVLVESGRAIAVGERTFGKGSVQGIYQLPDEHGQIKVTEQLYYLPSGRSLQRRDGRDGSDGQAGWGVEPSPGFGVPITDEHRALMAQARERRDVITTQDGPSTELHAPLSATDIITQRADPQLARAYEALVYRLATDQWQGNDTPNDTLNTAATNNTPANTPSSTHTAISASASTIDPKLRAAQHYREYLITELARMDTEITQIEKIEHPPPTDKQDH